MKINNFKEKEDPSLNALANVISDRAAEYSDSTD